MQIAPSLPPAVSGHEFSGSSAVSARMVATVPADWHSVTSDGRCLEYDLDSNALHGEGRAQYRERFILNAYPRAWELWERRAAGN